LSTAAQIFAFLAEHLDLFELLYDAIKNRGQDKAKIVAAINVATTAAFDARADKELGPK